MNVLIYFIFTINNNIPNNNNRCNIKMYYDRFLSLKLLIYYEI